MAFGNLKDRIALLTGASGAIGRRLAIALAERGVHVAMSGRDVDALAGLAEEVGVHGIRTATLRADLTASNAAADLVARSEKAIGPVDLLINNAGTVNPAEFTANSTAQLKEIATVNFTAPMLLSHAVLPGMLRRGRGHIVNVASLAGKTASPYLAPYGATKAALIALTRSLRAEYGNTPVGFSVICPATVAGPGMYTKIGGEELETPRAFLVSMEKVVDVTIEAIERDQPERIVAAVPVRPMIALSEAFPRVGEKLVAHSGAPSFFRQAAEQGRGHA